MNTDIKKNKCNMNSSQLIEGMKAIHNFCLMYYYFYVTINLMKYMLLQSPRNMGEYSDL